MIVKTIPSTWLIEEEHRLDCGPFVKGGIEARKAIERLRYPKDHLVNLTRNGINGMYHVGQDKITWAEDEIHGMPFLRSKDILKADLSYQPFISRKQVAGNHLFQCPSGSTLITRSGTIGRMVYMRADMEDMAISQDVLKVVPDQERVKPGYLYAFLNSKYGIPIVTGGTFGSIIVHIEAENIAKLPVPRLGAVEDQAHDLIQEAAGLRVEASWAAAEATELLETSAGLRKLSSNIADGIGFSANTISSARLTQRMDGAFHSSFHREVLDALDAASIPLTSISAISESIVEPKRFKRIQIEDPQFGIPMFGTSELMWTDPQPSYLIPKSMNGAEDLLVDQKTVLIPRSGQISGIIGTAVLPYGALVGGAVSEDAIRINCDSEVNAGFIFIALRSEYGRRQLKARAYGSSIPHLDVSQIGQVLVPDLPEEIWKKIGHLGIRTSTLRTKAIECETEARTLVERTIEEGGR